MEVIILDSLYRPNILVDRFVSLIWTERFSSKGDFELVLLSTQSNRARFTAGTRLATTDSDRVMTVETVEDISDDEGKQLLKVKGFSLESVLEQRAALADLSDLTADPKWILEGFPKDIAEQLFHDICVVGTLDSGDIISGVVEGSGLYPVDTIPAPTEEIIYTIDPKSLYLAIKELCDVYAMGFRLIRDPVTSTLYFDIYMGSDRTTAQTTLAAVVFSPDMDNLRSTNRLTSNALYKNVAYVMTPVGHEVVYPGDVDPSVAGFERRVLLVVSNDITDPDPPTASAQMIQLGIEELAKNRQFTALDGELTPQSQFVYGTHYFLGDVVELRDDDGGTSYMQVKEYIRVSDGEGNRGYPTLETNLFITPGSWSSYITEEWVDFDTEVWEELP